jgi:hypothetical protein
VVVTLLCGWAGVVKHGVLQSCTPYSLCLQAPRGWSAFEFLYPYCRSGLVEQGNSRCCSLVTDTACCLPPSLLWHGGQNSFAGCVYAPK